MYATMSGGTWWGNRTMKRLGIYLSSTFEDLRDYRTAVFAALEKAGLDVARMEAYTAADERPLDLCLRDVAQQDVYIGIWAWRYGYEPPAEHGNPEGKSITELEYRQAEACKLHKLLFFAHPDTKAGWPEQFKDEATGRGASGAKIEALRTRLGTEKTASFFRTPDELATLVLAAIMRSRLTGRPYNIPPRPAGFVPRPALTRTLVDSLLAAAPGAGVLVWGPGGFGKTSLAIDACHWPEIVNAFPGGMLWLTLGQDPDLVAKLSDLHVAVTDRRPAAVGPDGIVDALAKLLAGRRCLLVVDDVWRADDMSPLLRLADVQFLATTRVRMLLQQGAHTGWREVNVDEMEGAEAAAMLARGVPADDQTEAPLIDLANRLGCWSLLLDLVNARLLEELKTRRGDLTEAIDRVTSLFERRGVLGFDRRDANARNAAVATSVGVGLEAADAMFPGLADKASELSIFPEDVPIPLTVLADLWDVDELEVEEDVARPLDNLSVVRWDRQTNELRIHDMIQKALATRLSAPAQVTRRLIDRWNDPFHLPHGYAWRWLGWHCVQARDPGRLLHLLLDVKWLAAKLAATDINSVLGDFDHLRDEPRAQLLHDACRRAAHILTNDPSQLPAQLLARIPLHERQLRDQLLEQALSTTATWLRPLTPSLAGERSIRWLRPTPAEPLQYVTISSDGRWAAHVSWTPDDGVVLWNLQDWQAHPHRLAVPKSRAPYALALSADGRWCLCADSIGGIYRLSTIQAEIWEGHAHRDLTIASLLALSADGQRALSACSYGRLVAWDIAAGQHEIVWDENANRVKALSLDAAGHSAIAARRDGSIDLVLLWPARPTTLFALPGEPCALACSHNISLVAAASEDGHIEVRSVQAAQATTQLLRTIAIGDRPTAMALSRDERYLAVGTVRGTIEIWDIASGALSARYPRAHTYEINCIVFSCTGSRVVSADSLHLKEWALNAGDHQQRESMAVRAAGQVKVTADGLRAIVMLEDGRLGVWSMRTGALESTVPAASDSQARTSASGSRHGLALASEAPRVLSWNERLMTVWDLDRHSRVGSLPVRDARDPTITPDGTRVVYTHGHVMLWRPDDDATIVLGDHDGDQTSHVAISPDGRHALSSGSGRTVWLWRLYEADSHHLTPLQRIQERARELGIRPPGNEARLGNCYLDSRDKPALTVFAGPAHAVVSTGDGSLFSVDTLDPDDIKARRFTGAHDSAAQRLTLSHDRRYAVTSSYDRTNRIWDLALCQCTRTLGKHPGFIEKVSSTFERALLTTFDGVLQIVSLRDGRLICAFEADKQITFADADAALEWVAACDQGGQLHFLHVENGDPPPSTDDDDDTRVTRLGAGAGAASAH